MFEATLSKDGKRFVLPLRAVSMAQANKIAASMAKKRGAVVCLVECLNW
jgi:hypothetical protein